MIQAETLFILSIHPAPDGTGFLAAMTMEGEPLGGAWSIPLPRWREIHASVELFRRHTKGTATPPELARHALESVGIELFAAFLEPRWNAMQAQALPGRPRMLVILSPVAEILLLPWEAALPLSGPPLGLEPGWFIRRLPHDEEGPRRCCLYLPPPPLRVLFMVAAPVDQEPILPDPEGDAFLHALLAAGVPPAWERVEGGDMESLRQHILRFQPHVVHLCGPAVVRNEQGFFCFEDASGASDPRSGKEMSRELFARAPVQLLVVSGQSAGHPPPSAALGMLCREVARHGVPMALAHPAALASPQGMIWATTLYAALGQGGEIDTALLEARHAIRAMGEATGHPGWTLPLLFGGTTQRLVMNRAAPPVRPPVLPAGPVADAWRRHARHRLLPTLLEGTVRVVFLTGGEGVGKRTLAAALAEALEGSGWTPLRLTATPHRPLTVARLLEAVRRGLLARGLFQEAETLKDPGIPLPDRLALLLTLLAEHPFLLVLEHLERDLDPQGRLRNPEFALFLPHLLHHLHGAARLLITSRRMPELPSPLPDTARVEEIPPLARGAALRLLLRTESLAPRLRFGDLTHPHLESLLPEAGFPPGFLAPLAGVVAAGGSPPPGWHGDPADGLLTLLPEEECALLTRVAVWGFPVPEAALAALLEQDATARISDWRERGLLHSDPARPDGWQVPSWLATSLPLDGGVHRLAGEHLLACFESNGEEAFGLDWVELLLEARGHFLRCGEFVTALNLTERICEGMLGLGLHHEIRRLHGELLAWQRHPVSLNRIGQSFLASGAWGRAMPWFEEACIRAGQETGWEQEGRVARLGLAQGYAGLGEVDKAAAIMQGIQDGAGET